MHVHNLCHLVTDVKRFGPLPIISSYCFESFLGNLKSKIRSGFCPLSQIANRVLEIHKINLCSTAELQYPILQQKTKSSKNGHNFFKKIIIAADHSLSNDENNK